MTPLQDTRDNYIPLDTYILQQAKIHPYDCNHSVDEAIEVQLPRWKRAEGYKAELEAVFYSDKTDTDTRIISDGDSFDFKISPEFAREWQPADQEALQAKEPKASSGMAVPFDLLAQQLIDKGGITLPPLKEGQHQDAGQTRLVEYIQTLADEKGLNNRNLSSKTINRHIKAARNQRKENY